MLCSLSLSSIIIIIIIFFVSDEENLGLEAVQTNFIQISLQSQLLY
jgi:hypothetical protein